MRSRYLITMAIVVIGSLCVGYVDTAKAIVAKFEFAFGSSGSGNGQFNIPNDVDVDATDRIIVADRGNDRIQIFDPDGNFLLSFPETQSGPPSELGVDKTTGNIAVLAIFLRTVSIYDGNGNFNFQFNTPVGSDRPNGMDVDKNGKIYVADGFDARVHVFNPDGSLNFQVGSQGPGNGQFVFGASTVDVDDKTGNIYVLDGVDPKVHVFDSGRNFLFRFGSAGTGDDQFTTPGDIAVDQLGRIFTSDAIADRIQVFDASGNFLLKFGETGLGNGQFDNPRALTIDSKGRIIVTDASNRIQVFSLDSDEDGVADPDDSCSDSNLDDTVDVDGCDSGVANPVFSDGCTLADLIGEIVDKCVNGAKNHGQFISCFAKGANDLKKDGIVTGDEKNALQSCAGQSSLP